MFLIKAYYSNGTIKEAQPEMQYFSYVENYSGKQGNGVFVNKNISNPILSNLIYAQNENEDDIKLLAPDKIEIYVNNKLTKILSNINYAIYDYSLGEYDNKEYAEYYSIYFLDLTEE